MRYVLDFGSGNAGSSPTFSVFSNADTLVAVTPPAISEASAGLFYFEFNWTTTTATSIVYKATVNGVELSDVIRSDEVPTATGTGTAGAAAVSWLWNAGQIVNAVALETGLSEVVDPYSSTDPNFVQLRGLLKTCGLELIHARDWKALVKECTITGDGATTAFNLPADFLRMADGSGWNRTTSLPLGGPLSSQSWQTLKASASVLSTTVLYRIIQHRMHFYEAPATGNDLRFDYVSRYWVTSSGAETPDLYFPATANDTIVLEPWLMTRSLKVKFLQAKGLDSTAAIMEYQSAYSGAAGNEPAPTLSLSGRGGGRTRFLDSDNVPDTGFGT